MMRSDGSDEAVITGPVWAAFGIDVPDWLVKGMDLDGKAFTAFSERSNMFSVGTTVSQAAIVICHDAKDRAAFTDSLYDLFYNFCIKMTVGKAPSRLEFCFMGIREVLDRIRAAVDDRRKWSRENPSETIGDDLLMAVRKNVNIGYGLVYVFDGEGTIHPAIDYDNAVWTFDLKYGKDGALKLANVMWFGPLRDVDLYRPRPYNAGDYPNMPVTLKCYDLYRGHREILRLLSGGGRIQFAGMRSYRATESIFRQCESVVVDAETAAVRFIRTDGGPVGIVDREDLFCKIQND